ncbi:MAG: DUF202 domain-containing protein [Armatimonadia bacterium]|nr:DUF202 domain-containing protein [Armatimonadia bacterium]
MSDEQDHSLAEDLADERTELADERTVLARERNELARQRTDASASRTVLANERTFSAWLRTALSGIGLGLAVPKLLASPLSQHVAMWLGLILIVLGTVAGMLAAKRYATVARELEEVGLDLTPGWVATTIVAALTLVGALAVVLVVMK